MKSERRTWQFWVWGFVFIFLAHALAVLRFGERETPAIVREPLRPFFYLSLDAASDRYLAERTLGRDPTLFALPNPHGFSGGAWQKFQPEAPRLTNGAAPLERLTLAPENLGQRLNDYLETNRPSEEQLLASLRARRSVDLRIPDEPLLTRTLVKVEGPLSARKILHQPPVPSAVYSEVLRRTVVSVTVNGDGVVEATTLSGESGSREADEDALQLARRFEFEPLPQREAAARAAATPTIGRLIFIWHVVNSTNATSATAGAP